MLIESEHPERCQLNLASGLAAILLSVREYKERCRICVNIFFNSCSCVDIRKFLMNRILQVNVFHQKVKTL